MNKIRMAKLFFRRALRSYAVWTIFFIIFFCIVNYFFLRSLAPTKIVYVEVPKSEPHMPNSENNYEDLKESEHTEHEEENARTNEAGQMGTPLILPDELLEESERRFAEFQFNIVASDMIPLNRSLPDYRAPECQTIDYRKDLPLTSIVIVFRNEAWSTLLRTVWSAINRTPHQYLQEIILVDDASELEFLGKKLDDYVQTLPVTVKVLRMKTRSGLIKGRLYGVENAEGKAVIFLDAHCECTEGWIEPLLSRITENPKAIVSPIIDVISDEDFQYNTAVTQVGGFDWILDFAWVDLPEQNDVTLPIRTPTIAGGLIAVNRQFFYDIGAYDEDMSIWGAENLEMSFRVWMCGGVLELMQCSRVGHVYRKNTPHSFPNGTRSTIFKNKARVAEVWMDKWKDIFFALNPNTEPGDVSKRNQLRKDLNCNSFEWYLKNIYPETTLPIEFHHLGLIQNKETMFCIDATKDVRNDVPMEQCDQTDPFQLYSYTINRTIQSDKFCLSYNEDDNFVVLFDICDARDDGQDWFYDEISNNIYNLRTGKCLTNSVSNILELNECDTELTRQQWQLLKWVK